MMTHVTSLLSASLIALAVSTASAQTPPAEPENPSATEQGPRGPGAGPSDSGRRGPGYGPGRMGPGAGSGRMGPGGPGGPGRMGPGAGTDGMGPGGFGWGPGMMMGPGMMGGRGFMGGPGMMCSPRAAGLAGWRLRQVERAVKLNDAQRKALDDLREASAKAADSITASCPTEIPSTSVARMEMMEERMEAMLQAIKTVRPAFDAFYNSLDDKQKASLDRTAPRGWGWRSPRGGDR